MLRDLSAENCSSHQSASNLSVPKTIVAHLPSANLQQICLSMRTLVTPAAQKSFLHPLHPKINYFPRRLCFSREDTWCKHRTELLLIFEITLIVIMIIVSKSALRLLYLLGSPQHFLFLLLAILIHLLQSIQLSFAVGTHNILVGVVALGRIQR